MEKTTPSPEVVDVALRMCNIELAKPLLERVLDVVDLLSTEQGNVSISDIEKLKQRWRLQAQVKPLNIKEYV